MRPPCKSAAEVLADSPLGGLIDRARLLGRISTIIAEVSREAAHGAGSMPAPRCAFHGRTVIVTVGTPSHAAKLRQCATALERALRERVPEVTAIRVRLQPSGTVGQAGEAGPPAVAPTPAVPAVPAADLAAALRFADDLARQPEDSALRRAARRLQAQLRARLGGIR